MLFGLLKGMNVEESAVLANRFASVIVGVEGCSLDKLNQEQILD
jgi:hypothetical protein